MRYPHEACSAAAEVYQQSHRRKVRPVMVRRVVAWDLQRRRDVEMNGAPRL